MCVHNDSSTLAHIRARGAFAVNLLGQRGQRAAEVFSSPVTDRFATIRWRPTPALGLPFLIDHAHAVGECRTQTTYTVGDHTIVIGALAGVISRDDDLVPLLHGMRRYRVWPG